jgi:hypothetical protein
MLGFLMVYIGQDNYQIGNKCWKYVKARKRETVGVSTLKVNGETIENSKGKAEALILILRLPLISCMIYCQGH